MQFDFYKNLNPILRVILDRSRLSNGLTNRTYPFLCNRIQVSKSLILTSKLKVGIGNIFDFNQIVMGNVYWIYQISFVKVSVYWLKMDGPTSERSGIRFRERTKKSKKQDRPVSFMTVYFELHSFENPIPRDYSKAYVALMSLSDSRLRSLVSCQTNFVSETVRRHHGNWQASFARTCILKWLSSVLSKVPWLKHCHHDISMYTNFILYSLYLE